MVEIVELEQVEKLVEQLPPAQQLKLVAIICEHLSTMSTITMSAITMSAIKQIEENMERLRQKRLQLAEKLLSDVDDIEDDSQGELDAAADLRRLREERLKQICQSDA